MAIQGWHFYSTFYSILFYAILVVTWYTDLQNQLESVIELAGGLDCLVVLFIVSVARESHWSF